MSDYEIIRAAVARILADHGLALGCWGIPEGAEPTFTRAEYLRKAKALNALSDAEIAAMTRKWGAIWLRDLSD